MIGTNKKRDIVFIGESVNYASTLSKLASRNNNEPILFNELLLTNFSKQYKKNNEDEIYGNLAIRCIKDYKYLYRYENLSFFWRIMLKFSLLLHNLIIDSGNDKNKIKCRLFLYMKNAFDPFDWYARFINLIDKSLKTKQ